MSPISDLKLVVIVLLTVVKGSWAASFTVLNNCGYTVWPGFQSNAGMARTLPSTGFELRPGTTRIVEIPAEWSGRVWGRTGCTFGADGKGSCSTGDCSGHLQCNGAGVFQEAPLEAVTQNPVGLDWYDVSLVDNFFLPPVVVARRGEGADIVTGGVVDINLSCPEEDDGDANDNVLACKNACQATGIPQYCCIQAYAHPNSELSQISPLICADAYYAVAFCPRLPPASTSLATGPMVSAGTSNSNGAGRIIIGDSKVGKVNSPAPSSMPTWTASILILIGLLLVKTC